MRRWRLVPILGVALLLVLLLLRERGSVRGGGGARGEAGSERPAARATHAGEDAAAAATRAPGAGRTAAAPPVAFDGRLVYLDGAPAVGVLLHLAVGHPFETRVFRNGDLVDKTIHLVTAHVVTTTGAEGEFLFPPVAVPPGARRFVYARDDAPAFVVEELFGNGITIAARRRVAAKGRLSDRDGNALPDCWVEAQLGEPEGFDTRVRREEDSFASVAGDLGVDTLAQAGTASRADGSFALRLAEGRNTFSFGEDRTRGALAVDVGAATPDLGDLRVAGPPPGRDGRVTGVVRTLAGAPHAGCEVCAWDGSVGLPTHATETDAAGAFAFEGLRSSAVIVWAVPTERWHVDLPSQSSGTIRMPCAAPVALVAPAEAEYAWARGESGGYYGFVRDGVWLGGATLGPNEAVGLPAGPYHILLLTADGRLRSAAVLVREPGDLALGLDLFRDWP